MAKFTLLILTLASSAAIACGGKKAKTDAKTSTETQAVAANQTPMSVSGKTGSGKK